MVTFENLEEIINKVNSEFTIKENSKAFVLVNFNNGMYPTIVLNKRTGNILINFNALEVEKFSELSEVFNVLSETNQILNLIKESEEKV